MEPNVCVVIAKGKISECVLRATDALKNNQVVAILGKQHSISMAVTIAEITKRET